MLADRLAGKSDFDTQRERRTMELLKLRFGEANLHNADIMLGVCAQYVGRESREWRALTFSAHTPAAQPNAALRVCSSRRSLPDVGKCCNAGCDAVLQDVAASKRINAFVHAAKPELGRFKTTIVSELFWPPLQGEPVELPPQVRVHLVQQQQMQV